MKRFADFLVNSIAASVLVVVIAASIILFLIPPLHPAAWLIGLLGSLAAAVCAVLLARQWARAQARIDRLNEELAAAWGHVEPVALTAVEADDGGADARRAARIGELLPQGEGLVADLRVAGGPGSLRAADLQALAAFLREFERESFDDRACHRAFMDLYRSAERLSSWVRAETDEAQAGARAMRSGDARRGGWREFGQAQAAGEEAAGRLVAARADFQRAALESGALR
ncbi:hypothetical protein GSY69_11215 [Brevibacterium sp. 5221]|uniref:Uncharacterized protein n=1 Tax=Brevibacterium rongguiense TaxID=2695267 RepID=A0A6N9H8Z9_9MICO|nr:MULTISPECIES: hypothetical protein [Brevibacterium]MYM20518.1 hypothetical protein [Brevibacterium rongguiense]WAL40998.1 hypothetical protein BRM1_03800 [Brevibacterium sp. BRM-1]